MPATRPSTYSPQTLASAKASYRKHGPRLTSQEARQLERGGELFRRAEKIKDAERRRKENAKKKLEREKKEREGRRKMGIVSPVKGLVTRVLGVGEMASQRTLGGLGFFKVCSVKEEEVRQETVDVKTEPWEEECLDDVLLLGLEVIVQKEEECDPSTLKVGAIKEEGGLLPTSTLVTKTKLPSSLVKRTTNTAPESSASAPNNVNHISTGDALDLGFDFVVSNTQIARELSSTPAQPVNSVIKAIQPHRVSDTKICPILHYKATKPKSRVPARAVTSKISTKPNAVYSLRDSMLMPPPLLKPSSTKPKTSTYASPLITAKQHIMANSCLAKPSDTGPTMALREKSGNRIASGHNNTRVEQKKVGLKAPHETKWHAKYVDNSTKENHLPSLLLRDEDFILSTQDCREIYGY